MKAGAGGSTIAGVALLAAATHDAAAARGHPRGSRRGDQPGHDARDGRDRVGVRRATAPRAAPARGASALLIVGGALVIGGSFANAAITIRDEYSSVFDVAAVLVGSSVAMIGAWDVFLPGPVEQAWLTCREFRPRIVRPAAPPSLLTRW